MILRSSANLIASAPPLVLPGPGWTPPLVIAVMTSGVEPPPILELLDRDIKLTTAYLQHLHALRLHNSQSTTAATPSQ